VWELSVPAGANGGGAWVDAVSFEYGGNVLADAVGIGVSNPLNILTVQQGSVTDPIADSWTTYSSRRWKTNIRRIRDPLAIVSRLHGVRFDWKKDGKHDVGLIAEEVGKVLPEIVTWEPNGRDARGLDYARLVPVLIEGTKEQQHEIRALRQRQASLETRLSRLERLLATAPARAAPGTG
jgi:hypothetical protein